MRATMRGDRGFTLIELLVVVALFAVVSVGLYQVMLSSVRGNETAQDVATIAQEARLGLNRVVRDTREASSLLEATDTSYTISVRFPGSDVVEDLTYSYHAGSKTIRLNGQVLIKGVEPIGTTPIFTYSSNRLEYDWDANGITSWEELNEAATHGVTLAPDKLIYVSNVAYTFRVSSGPRQAEFYAQAQWRNRR
jgi:prepilin-type N-terminal cleavage/methylation domain-containing protein